MTTITIDDPKITEVYSSEEIQVKFFEFLQDEFGEHEITLAQISVDDLSAKSRERFDAIDTMNFV